MRAPNPVDWSHVDWSKTNVEIAKVWRCRTKRVADERRRLGIPKTDVKAATRLGRKKALEAGRYESAYKQKSFKMKGKPHGRGPKMAATHLAKGPEHPNGRFHRLVSPEGTLKEFENAQFFVRDNPELFEAEDVIQRIKPNGHWFTRAGNGLQAVSNGSKPQWKGWIKA
jgi:hypothetical protein